MLTPKSLSFASPNFWPTVKGQVAASGLGLFSDDGLIFGVMSHHVRMTPIVRTKEELFSATIDRANQTSKFEVVINGQMYDVSKAGIADALLGSDPVAAEHTTIEGTVAYKRVKVAGRVAKQMFHVAYDEVYPNYYKFGFGPAPIHVAASLGGCGPLIINGLKFGSQNAYAKGSSGPKTGQPTEEQGKNLMQRSNLTYAALSSRPPYTGKTILAHSSIHKVLAVLIQPHGGAKRDLNSIRDALVMKQFDNAVFMDGSDSSLLVVKGNHLIRAASDKNETNTVGIGFSYRKRV